MQGVAVAAEIVGGANPGEKKRYWQRGCFREASEKSLVRGSFCLVFLELGFEEKKAVRGKF